MFYSILNRHVYICFYRDVLSVRVTTSVWKERKKERKKERVRVRVRVRESKYARTYMYRERIIQLIARSLTCTYIVIFELFPCLFVCSSLARGRAIIIITARFKEREEPIINPCTGNFLLSPVLPRNRAKSILDRVKKLFLSFCLCFFFCCFFFYFSAISFRVIYMRHSTPGRKWNER